MYRTQCVLGLLALYVGLSHSFSWDVVLTVSQDLEFYNNGTKMHTEVISSATKNIITSIAYDPVHDRVLFAEKRGTYFSISSYNIATGKIQSLFRSKHYASIRIAYDPATQLLFWIDSVKRNIHSFLSKPGSNNTDDNVLINCDDKKFYSYYIAVDSCGGYIYWTTESKIERARFDGSEREVVIDTKARWREGIALDQQTQKMYWIEYRHVGSDIQIYIESADLKGENRKTLYTGREGAAPTALTVSKDFIYWKMEDTIRQLSKNASRDEDLKFQVISIFDTSYGFDNAIASNYKIKDQIHGNQNCEALKSQLPINSEPSDNDVSLFCVHGKKVSGEYRCECTQGYIGERCDVSVCHNYCFQGDCSVSAEGQPQCRCNDSYSGERCEVNACQEYCLNSGVCSLNVESEPVCQCTKNYEGERCGVPVFLVKCFQTVSMLRDILNTDVTPVTLGKGVKSTCASTAV